MRTKLLPLILVFATACFGSGGNKEPLGSPSVVKSADGVEAQLSEQRVVLAHGATVVQTSLVVACVDKACQPIRAQKIKVIRVLEERPIFTITFEQKPDSVRALFKSKGRRGPATELDPGLLVAWRPKLPSGRHDARISATYGSVRLEWSVGIKR